MKKVLYVFIAVFSLLIFNINVYAEDINGQELVEPVLEYDDDGRVTSGEVCAQDSSSAWDNIHTYTFYGDYFYMYKKVDTNNSNLIRYYVVSCNNTGKYDLVNHTYQKGKTELYSSSVANEREFSEEINVCVINSADSNNFSELKYSTIPIFDKDDENFDNYVNNYIDNGDTSGAVNSDQFKSDPNQSDDVVKPLNLKTFGRIFNLTVNGVDNTDVTDTEGVYNTIHTGTTLGLNWSPPDNDVISDYSYDVRFRVTYYVHTRDNRTTTDWCNIVSDYPYERNSHVDINTGESVPRTSDVSETCRINESEFNKLGLYWREYFVYKNYSWYVGAQNVYIVDAEIQVRNRCNGKYSNWVSVSSAANTGYNSTNVKDNNGNVVDDDDYHGQDTSTYNDPTDSDNNFNVDINNVSINGILQFIRDGFGLIGSNGILSLMGKTFLFLPSSIWIILKFFVSMMVAISIVKLVKDVIL